MKNLILIVILFLPFSCNKTIEEDKVIMPKEAKEISIEIDTIRIETPGTMREFHYSFPSLNYSGRIFAGLDERTGRINIIDLATMELSDTILLYQEGPNTIQKNMVGGIYYHSPDSIFILQHIPNRLLIINTDGEIIWQKDLNELFKKNTRFSGLLAFAWFDRIGIYFRDEKVYFALRQNQAEQDYLAPMIGYYDFESDKVQTLDIHYPEFYTTNPKIGYFDTPCISFIADRIMVTYPYTTDIFIYDISGKLQKHVLNLPNLKLGRAQDPSEEKLAHFKSNPFYLGLQSIEKGKYFLRFGNGPEPEDPENTTYKFSIIYNSNFTKFHVIDKNERPISFGGPYFFYPIPPEQTDYQLLERYQIDME